MLGSTFVLVARMDRRQSKALATAAPFKEIASGLVTMVVQDRLADLYINDDGVYGAATEVAHLIDFPHDDVDRGLATTDMGEASTHVSKIGNLTGATMVDADGDGTADSVLCATGIADVRGRQYYAAVRVMDACSLMNANTAYSNYPLLFMAPLSRQDISLILLLGNTPIRDAIITARRGTVPGGIQYQYDNDRYIIRLLDPNPSSGKYRPFDMGDMLAIRWLGSGQTARGRLHDALSTKFASKRQFLTTWSAWRMLIPVPVVGDTAQTHMADLNKADYAELYNAFYNAIPLGASGFTTGTDQEKTRKRALLAAQLAVNVIDFRDTNSDITAKSTDSKGNTLKSADGLTDVAVYGIERQPFVTEAFGKRYKKVPLAASGDPVVESDYWAVELFNPYTTDISLADYTIECGAASASLSGSITGGGRVVLVDESAKFTVATGATTLQIASLDLSGGAKIYRTVGGKKVLMANIGPLNVPIPTPADGEEKKNVKNVIWHDGRKEARYTRTITTELSHDGSDDAHDYTNADLPGTTTAGTTILGAANDSLPAENLPPCPVYVRNTLMISVGDLSRIFHVGPSETMSLREKLGNVSSLTVGRLPMRTTQGGAYDVTVPPVPQIPLGALMTNYVMVGSPMADQVGGTAVDNDGDGKANDMSDPGLEDQVYGAVNINTVSSTVLKCTGGLGRLATTTKTAVADAIIAHRTTHKGFLSQGEVAIPMATAGVQNEYDIKSPMNYAIADGKTSDDGLPTLAGDRVEDDMIKYLTSYTWSANEITVRSDVYIAYIRVQIGDDADTTKNVQHYISVIDRGNCRRPTDRPLVRMFSRVR